MAEPALRILQINTELGWRGGERQTLLTAEGLRARGYSVELLLRRGSVLAERARARNFVVHIAGGGLSFGCWLALHGRRFDVLHAQTAKVVAWAVAVAFIHRRPVVFSRRTSFPLRGGIRLKRLKWQRVAQMVAISEAAALAPRSMEISTRVIPSAVLPITPDSQRIERFLKNKKLQGRRLVGTVAALSVEKDPVTLIQAAAKVCSQFEDVVFVHWGAPGSASSAAEQVIDELGLRDRYFLLGFEPDVEQLLSVLSVFAMASRSEALGSSVFDAMLQKVPVVSTDAGGLKEAVAPGRGLLCASGDAQAMAEHISFVLAHPAQAHAMAEVAYAAVRAHYAVDTMIGRYIEVYRDALEH